MISTADPCRELLERACRFTPGGVHSGRRNIEPPLCVARAHGQYIEDMAGRSFIDYQAGAGAVILGHADRAVSAAVTKAAERGLLFGIGTTEAEVDLAAMVVRHVPSVEKVLFCNSGSEATLNAIRLARAVTRREKIVKFQGCYHGFHDYVLMSVDSRPDRIGKRDPHSEGMLDAAVDNTLVSRFNDTQAVDDLVRSHGEQVAAIILEPVAHNGPGILPRPGFLEHVRGLCDEVGALLIFDEVITGFRHGLGGYQEICGVMPDLTTLGKAIANGAPLAALGGRSEYMERFNTNPDGDVVFAGTYNGNSLAVAAGLATLEQLEGADKHTHLFRLGDRMRQGLRRIVDQAGIGASVCGFGSIFALCFMEGPVESYDDVVRNDVDLFIRYRSELMARGIFEVPDLDGTRSHVTLSHTEANIDETLEAASDALRVALG